MARFIFNETSYQGRGSRSEIAVEIKKRGFKKVLLVTDQVLNKVKVAEKVEVVLKNAGIEYEIFDNIKANPTIKNCEECLEKLNSSKADIIVAVGGGSVIDTAKCVSIVKNNPEFSDIRKLEGVADTKNKAFPLIACATTCGTAAEVTINYVITDEENGRKLVCIDPNDIPIVAVIDSELMESMPGSLIASTGMDALTHAIEGLLTKGANDLSDMFHLYAIELIGKNLKNAVNGDKEALEKMALAQYVAGMGFSNVGLGLVHGMAHPLGGIFDIAHGVANALLLPYVLEYNEPICGEKYKIIAKLMGGKADAKEAVQLIKKLSSDVHIPQKLRDINIKESDLERLSIDAFNDVCTGGNPRETSQKEILEIYKKAF
ncbi:MAG: lactaldehyde reductase [Fusobacteriaceae bacterium]